MLDLLGPLMAEIWKPIEGYEAYYSVSSLGRVFSFRTEKYLKPIINGAGYFVVNLTLKSVMDKRLIHQLVCSAFHGACPTGRLTRHLDGNKLNNQESNLCWGTPKENSDDNAKYGVQLRGEAITVSKLTELEVHQILVSVEVQEVLAKRFGVSQVSISNIKSRKTWRHVVV